MILGVLFFISLCHRMPNPDFSVSDVKLFVGKSRQRSVVLNSNVASDHKFLCTFFLSFTNSAKPRRQLCSPSALLTGVKSLLMFTSTLSVIN